MGAKLSIGTIYDGIIFGIHIFILGPIAILKTSKISDELFSGDGDKAMSVVFAIMASG